MWHDQINARSELEPAVWFLQLCYKQALTVIIDSDNLEV